MHLDFLCCFTDIDKFGRDCIWKIFYKSKSTYVVRLDAHFSAKRYLLSLPMLGRSYQLLYLNAL